jgi:hypothetical protein
MKSITLTVTAARSGTRLLYKLLSEVPAMHADHEEMPTSEPSFCYMRQKNVEDPLIGRDFVENYFTNYVNDLPSQYYSCTAQSTSKGFIEHFLDLGITPNFIIIRRNPRLIAKSLWELEWIPGKHPLHRIWYPGPQEPNVLPFENWRNSHPYQLCYWYVADCERRTQYYEKMLPSKNLKIWHTTIEQMLDVDHFNFMLDHFNLPNVDSLPQKKVNRLQSWRKREVLPDNDNFFHKLELDFLERIPKEFKENLISRGWGDV